MPLAGGIAIKRRILLAYTLFLSVHIRPEQSQGSVLDGPLTSSDTSDIQFMLKCYYLGPAFSVNQPGY